MVTFAVGSVVLIPFPFSDLSQSKLRPAVVLADAGRDDWVLCQITSKPYADSEAVRIDTNDISNGSLRVVSYARPGKLFTANSSLIQKNVGELRMGTMQLIVDAVVVLLRNGV